MHHSALLAQGSIAGSNTCFSRPSSSRQTHICSAASTGRSSGSQYGAPGGRHQSNYSNDEDFGDRAWQQDPSMQKLQPKHRVTQQGPEAPVRQRNGPAPSNPNRAADKLKRQARAAEKAQLHEERKQVRDRA